MRKRKTKRLLFHILFQISHFYLSLSRDIMAENGNKDLISVDLPSKVELCEVKQSQNGNTLAWTCQARQDSREHAKVSNLRMAILWHGLAKQDRTAENMSK